MATLAREILSADKMEVRISCRAMSYVGIGITGTWEGSITFSASQDEFGTGGPGGGSSFKTTSVFERLTAPTPGANSLSSVTANGFYYWPGQNYGTFRAVFSRTSGSPVVALAASIDSSWADAFFTPGNKFVNSFANGTQNVLTVPAGVRHGRRLRSLVVTAVGHVGGGGGTGSSSSTGPASASWASNPILRIYDGNAQTGTLLYAYDLPNVLPIERTIPLPAIQTTDYGVTDGGVYFTPGNVGTIILASGGSGVATNINAEVGTA